MTLSRSIEGHASLCAIIDTMKLFPIFAYFVFAIITITRVSNSWWFIAP